MTQPPPLQRAAKRTNRTHSQVEADIAEARAREADPAGAAMSHDEFMAQLEEEDRQGPAS